LHEFGMATRNPSHADTYESMLPEWAGCDDKATASGRASTGTFSANCFRHLGQRVRSISVC